MSDQGWTIVLTRAPAGTYRAGRLCWAILLNGQWVQGFRLKDVASAFTWGRLNGKGRIRFAGFRP